MARRWSDLVRYWYSVLDSADIRVAVQCGGLLAALLWASPPLHAQAGGPSKGEVTKQSLLDTIKGDAGADDLSTATADKARAFLADKSKPVRERLEVKIAFEQARLQRRRSASHEAQLLAHAEHAEELIRDFPEQPEGYGYLLSVAKAEKPAKARRMAESLLASPAPESLKRGAERVLARLDLVGEPLRLAGAEAQVEIARGRPLVIYTWSAESAGIKDAVRRLASAWRDMGFIGINLDADRGAAQTAAAGLPGVQLYDGGGLEGPLARQLQLTMPTALYLVDAEGVIREVDAHRDPEGEAARLFKGGRR